MKKGLARNINKANREIKNEVEVSTVEISSIADKILKNGNLTLEDINHLGECIAQRQGYDKSQLIVCDVTELNEHLTLHKEDDVDEKPLFIVCNNEKSISATFCIVNFLDKTVCLYKDFLNIQVSENIKNILEQHFGKDIEFKVSTLNSISLPENQKDTNHLSLKTLETMMVYLMPDKRKDFIEGFTDTKKKFFQWLKDGTVGLTGELFSLVKEGYYNNVASDIVQLSRDEEFKKAIKELINSMPSTEEVNNFKEYQRLLKKFVEKVEKVIDEKEIEASLEELAAAREKAFSKTKELKIVTCQNDKKELQLDIEKKFPTQMEKFTRIFGPLTSSKVDQELDKLLQDICSKLDLEYSKLKIYFPIKEDKKQADCELTGCIRNIEDIISALPKLRDTTLVDTGNKPFKQLISEMRVGESDISKISESFYKVKGFYKSLGNKDALEINQWAVSKKGQLDDSEIYEALAIMDRANELVTGRHRLRDTQILSVLTFLQQKDTGQLSQIQTGEGKTTIVSIVAAIKALQGEVVDIVTSNPVLASDGIKDKKLFYDLLNLSATTNNLDEKYKSGERECYKADIVYGCIGNFQFDYLKHSFLGLKTRGDRKFERIILDEVDSMIIDNASHVAKLSGPLPGMESLKYVYIRIWQALHQAVEQIIQAFQKELRDKASNLQKLSDDEAQASYKEFEDNLKDSVIHRIKDHIKSVNPTQIDIIPSHIQEYAHHSLDRWIDSAIDAKFNYHEDEQYIIRTNKDGEKLVQPVDYANTGITLKNTIWQYGLHQFLQLKHNLHLTSESLTSCFISNLAYINKYGGKIFGLTGTLGSEGEQELLSSIYNVRYAQIPTYKEKKFKEIDGEVVDDEIFSEKVADDAIFKLNNGRSSLIICETIKDAKKIQEVLVSKRKNIVIKTFFDEENARITEEEIEVGQVVISTNIAGRGTDFKTSGELESNGGLQVCVAFLPCNKRVEDQAFGRTARQGNNGSAKLVIKKSEAEKLVIEFDSFEKIKELRDLKEAERIKQIQEIKIQELKFQDKLFECFSDLYRQLKREHQSEGEYQYVLDDLKEFWSFWLEKKNFQGSELANKCPEKEFADFKSEACGTIHGKIKFNPYYSIQQAEYFILCEKLDRAKQSIKDAFAISQNPEILHGAYIKRFEIAIEEGRVFMSKCRKAIGDLFFIQEIGPDRNYKKKAEKYLKQAIKALQKELVYIDSLCNADEFQNIIRSDSSSEVNKKDVSYWYSDNDMHIAGEKILESLVGNTLSKHQIETFCKEYQLQDKGPVFICYNVGGTTSQDRGIHWVGICVVKIEDRIKVFYKDPKGNFENNIEVVTEEFKKYYSNLDFIAHTKSDQNDDSSCGPMTIENLRIMAKSIQEDGIEKFIENFTSLTFAQQPDVSALRNEFADTLSDEPQKTENLFIKHIVSKQLALNLNVNQAESLIEQINEYEHDISISGRTSDYFSNLKPISDEELKIKNIVTNSELSELSSIGTNTTYALKIVHDVCPEVVKFAQAQIGGGIALITTGFCFPPALPVASSIGGTMITEGICDIAIELINKNSDGKFNKDAYIKGKVISYGISFLTMGINAAMQCPKILNEAKKACRWISATLRKCPFLRSACETLATNIDKIGDWFEKMETIAKFNNMNKIEKLKFYKDLEKSKDLQKINYLGINIKQIQQVGSLKELTRFETCISTFKQVAISTTKNVATRTVESVIMSEVITPALKSLMSKIKPTIRKHVAKSIRENINQEKLKYSSYENIQNIIKEIRESIDYETIKDIFKDAILGITKHCSDWRVQLCAFGVDQYVSWKKLYDYAKDLCKKINGKLKSTAKPMNQNIDELIKILIEQFSEEMYSQFVSTTVKTCKDIYSVGRSAYENYKHDKKEEAKCLEINKNFKEGGQAGQEQAKALSENIKRPIYIYCEEGNRVEIGEQYLGKGTAIEISYFPPDKDNPNGHYVPFGHDKNWSSDDKGNNCLFDAVGSQIGKNPSTLRQNTVKQIESNPTRYIASYVRDISGPQILLEGGRANKPLRDEHYPSHENRIKAAPKHAHALAALRNKFNEHKEKDEQFCRRKKSQQKQYMDHNKSIPQFGTIPGKEEMMMGTLSVKFTDGSQFNCMTVSGNDAFSVKQSVSDETNLSYIKKPIPFSCKIDGFDFIDQGKPEGMIFDVYNRVDTQQQFTKSCAAQKNMYSLGVHMKSNPHLKIKGKVDMAESWYKPGNAPFKSGQVIINESCAYCEQVLPIATGKNFTGNGFINYQEFSYWNQYSKNGIEILLKLRLESINAKDVIVVTPTDIYDDTLSRTKQLMNQIPEIKQDIMLLSLNLYAKHWVGITIQKDQNGINIMYMDPEQNSIPVLLKEQLIKQIESYYPKYDVTLIESNLELQQYNNCGPEVIENFINYLTGSRLLQEDTLTIHSILYENFILSYI